MKVLHRHTSLVALGVLLLASTSACASAGAEPRDGGGAVEPRDGPVGEPVVVEPRPEPPPEERPEPELEPPIEEPVVARADTAVVVSEPEYALPSTAVRERRRALEVRSDALLPRRRIVAFYGNPASTRMGILGELPPDRMLERLDREVARWREADPTTPVVPALHMIAVMATADPGRDSAYVLRMPNRRIEQVLSWASRRDALVFLDIQPGLSSVRAELPRLEEWLRLPHVHLALDPEWDMPPGSRPGQRIGTMSVQDVNYAVEFLAELVSKHDLPPKVLVVHRFTHGMLPGAPRIEADPRVQVVINMDGWGPPAQKRQTYGDIVEPEATQFTGFKLFFHNDRRGGSRLLTPQELLRLRPPPAYVQYQ